MNLIPLADASLQGATLVLPTVSVGSVPQLAVDLLINAPEHKFRRIAYLDASDCVPFVSPAEPGTDAAFSTALEGASQLTVFQAPSGLTVVQQRSPAIKVRPY